MSEGSVSQWIDRLKAGEQEAAEVLWQRYFLRLSALARQRLQGLPRRAASEEDVALSAFASFCQGVARDRFPTLQDRDNLWRLLVVITARKAAHLLRYESQKKRSARADADVHLEEIVGREPTPEFAAEVAEECQRLLTLLDSDRLKAVALWKMDGYSNEEIAAHLGCAVRSVERKLRLIRALWEHRRNHD